VRGARIGITADRRAAEQAALVESLGGIPVLGAALAADEPREDEALSPHLERALAGPLDWVVFLTGVGARLTIELAARRGLEARLRDGLARAQVIARGPKPRRALRAAEVRVDRMADPPSALLIRDELLREPLDGRRVLLQGFGEDVERIAAPLRLAGAEVIVIHPYAAGWPGDPTPAQELAREAAAGRLAAITFTSAQAARQFVALAEDAGVGPAELRAGGALIAAVGPVTRAALEAGGVAVDIEPERSRMGTLYRAVAAALTSAPAAP
jgi:uroporphyrinogen-III synthase